MKMDDFGGIPIYGTLFGKARLVVYGWFGCLTFISYFDFWPWGVSIVIRVPPVRWMVSFLDNSIEIWMMTGGSSILNLCLAPGKWWDFTGFWDFAGFVPSQEGWNKFRRFHGILAVRIWCICEKKGSFDGMQESNNGIEEDFDGISWDLTWFNPIFAWLSGLRGIALFFSGGNSVLLQYVGWMFQYGLVIGLKNLRWNHLPTSIYDWHVSNWWFVLEIVLHRNCVQTFVLIVLSYGGFLK